MQLGGGFAFHSLIYIYICILIGCATPIDMLICTRQLTDTFSGRMMDPVLCGFVQEVRKEIEHTMNEGINSVGHICVFTSLLSFPRE